MAFNVGSVIDGIVNFVQKNAFLIIGLLIAGWLIWFFFLRNKKKDLKPISRSEIERKSFVERNKVNFTVYQWLYRGNELLGKILKMRLSEIKEVSGKKDIEEIPVIEIVYKPIFFKFGRFKFVNPFGQEVCLLCGTEYVELDKAFSVITIDERVTFDSLFGIYYDRHYENEMLDYIKINTYMRTEYQNLGNETYVESQKHSVIDHNAGIDMAMKEKELQIELAKKRGKQSSI